MSIRCITYNYAPYIRQCLDVFWCKRQVLIMRCNVIWITLILLGGGIRANNRLRYGK